MIVRTIIGLTFSTEQQVDLSACVPSTHDETLWSPFANLDAGFGYSQMPKRDRHTITAAIGWGLYPYLFLMRRRFP